MTANDNDHRGLLPAGLADLLPPDAAREARAIDTAIERFAAFGYERVKPPLIGECFANLECQAVDTRLVNKFGLFVLQVVKSWIDPAQINPKTIHHRGFGEFVVDGETITLKSRMP